MGTFANRPYIIFSATIARDTPAVYAIVIGWTYIPKQPIQESEIENKTIIKRKHSAVFWGVVTMTIVATSDLVMAVVHLAV